FGSITASQSWIACMNHVAQLPPFEIGEPAPHAPSGASPTSANAAMAATSAPASASGTRQLTTRGAERCVAFQGKRPICGLPPPLNGMPSTEAPTYSAVLAMGHDASVRYVT